MLLAVGLGVFGCSEEDIFEENQSQEINGIISQFSPETFGKVVSSDYKVNWDVSAPLEHSEELGLDYYEFGVSLSESQAPIANRLYDTKQSLLAVKREGGKFDFYVAKYFMDRWKSEGRSVRDVSFSKMEGFSGLLNVFDSGNEMVHAKRMDNGKILRTPLYLNSGFDNGNIENRMVEDCETVATYHYIDTYQLNSEGSWEKLYSQLVDISYETECYSSYYPDLDLGGGGGSGTYYSQNGGGPYANCEDPRHGCIYNIDDDFLYPLQDQTSFPALDYTSSTKSQRISRIFNFIRYNNKINSPLVNLNNAFTNLPIYTSSGYPFDNFTGTVMMGTEAIQITLIEVPLAESFRIFNRYSETKQVTTGFGERVNIRYNVPCNGCSNPLGALLIQVKPSDSQKVIDFLDGKG